MDKMNVLSDDNKAKKKEMNDWVKQKAGIRNSRYWKYLQESRRE
jgi:hypothetical protein